jgi:hypothetical protein
MRGTRGVRVGAAAALLTTLAVACIATSRPDPGPAEREASPTNGSWSRPEHPRRVVGRFSCRTEQGRAAMWWTDVDRGVLAHAVAPDDDLALLLAWWCSHSER